MLPIDLILKMSLLRIKCPPFYLFHAAHFHSFSEYLSISTGFTSFLEFFLKRFFRPRVSLNKKHVTVRLFEEIFGQLGTGRGTKCSK